MNTEAEIEHPIDKELVDLINQSEKIIEVKELDQQSPVCSFYKQTSIIDHDNQKGYTVSTIGMLKSSSGTLTEVGFNRFYETLIFPCDLQGKITRMEEQYLEGVPEKWCISEPDKNEEAEEIHKSFVYFVVKFLS